MLADVGRVGAGPADPYKGEPGSSATGAAQSDLPATGTAHAINSNNEQAETADCQMRGNDETQDDSEGFVDTDSGSLSSSPSLADPDGSIGNDVEDTVPPMLYRSPVIEKLKVLGLKLTRIIGNVSPRVINYISVTNRFP